MQTKIDKAREAGQEQLQQIQQTIQQTSESGLLETIQEAGTWAVIASSVAVAYIGISIILEVLDIIFLLTPTKKDDAILDKIQHKWEKWRPFLKWLNIKTPLTSLLEKVHTGLQLIKKIIENKTEEFAKKRQLAKAEKTQKELSPEEKKKVVSLLDRIKRISK